MVNLHSLLTVWLEGDSPFSLGYSLSFPVELGLVFLFNFRTVWTRTTIKSIEINKINKINIFEILKEKNSRIFLWD